MSYARIIRSAFLASMWLALCVSCAKQEPSVMYFFYEAVCPACPESQLMQQIAGTVSWVAGQSKHEAAEIYDVFRGDGITKLGEVAKVHGVTYEELLLPVLFAGGKVYQGEQDVTAYLDSRRK